MIILQRFGHQPIPTSDSQHQHIRKGPRRSTQDVVEHRHESCNDHIKVSADGPASGECRSDGQTNYCKNRCHCGPRYRHRMPTTHWYSMRKKQMSHTSFNSVMQAEKAGWSVLSMSYRLVGPPKLRNPLTLILFATHRSDSISAGSTTVNEELRALGPLISSPE